MLEEHIREIELQSQERLIEEQKRHKELVQRLEVRPCPIIQSSSQLSSRSAHRTTNFMNPEFQFPQFYESRISISPI